VIKDCFITKKMNTKNSTFNVAQSISPQKRPIQKQSTNFNLKMSSITK
jgi:hypothetical protein